MRTSSRHEPSGSFHLLGEGAVQSKSAHVRMRETDPKTILEFSPLICREKVCTGTVRSGIWIKPEPTCGSACDDLMRRFTEHAPRPRAWRHLSPWTFLGAEKHTNSVCDRAELPDRSGHTTAEPTCGSGSAARACPPHKVLRASARAQQRAAVIRVRVRRDTRLKSWRTNVNTRADVKK